MRSARSLLLLAISFLLLAIFISPNPSYAQNKATNSAESPLSTFSTPNTDPDVPQNQSTLAQTVTIEVVSAIICQLSGINPINRALPCLGINSETKRIGYVQNDNSPDAPQVGGLVGAATNMIAFTYQPAASSQIYTQYLSDNFGIVKKAHAQVGGYGFEGLKPIFSLWISVRNIAYGILVIAFAFIGVGIMLRVKIDPRTVMSIQNQIPKTIMSIILITFSYAISAFLIDLMWVSTYAGVNLIINSSDAAKTLDTRGKTSLEDKANRQLLEIPFTYANNLFQTKSAPGILHITHNVSENISFLLQDVVENILGVDKGDSCVDGGGISLTGGIDLPGVNVSACLANALGIFTSVIAQLIILIVILIALFRIWFQLVKAFIYTLFYVIIGPVYIVFGLLPSKPLGFEKWLRSLFVNLAIFPITAFVIVAARVMMDAYNAKATPDQFIPPLIGHNVSANFGSLLAFGALLIAPSLQKILQEKMGVKGVGSPGLVAAGIAAGAAVVGAPVGRGVKHLTRRDSTNKAVGALAVGKQHAGNWMLGQGAKLGIPFTGAALEKRKEIQGRAYGVGEQEARQTAKKRIKDDIGNVPFWGRRKARKKYYSKEETQKRDDARAAARTGGGAHVDPAAAAPPNVNPTVPSATGGVSTEVDQHVAAHPGDKATIMTTFAEKSKGEKWHGKDLSELKDNDKKEAEAMLRQILEEVRKDH